MKLRIIATPEEFDKILPAIEKRKKHFDSWRKPQKGNNPKYKDNPQLLQYLEMTPKTFLKIIGEKP